ncbi:MAG: hypothetical protein ACI4LA_05370 [Emergencia sp.]
MTEKKCFRTVAIALCITMIISLVPGMAFAETAVSDVARSGLIQCTQDLGAIGDESSSFIEFYIKAEEQLQKKKTSELKCNIANDIRILEQYGILSKELSVEKVVDNKIRYKVDFDGYENHVWAEVDQNNQGDIILRLNDNGIENVLRYTTDNRLFVDGNEVIISTGEILTFSNENAGEIVHPNKTSTSFRKDPFSGITTSQYNKLIETYTNNNVVLGEPFGSFSASALSAIVAAAIRAAFGKTMPGLAAGFFLTVCKTILNDNVSYGSEDAYLSFRIKKKKCESKSTTYEQFYIHEGSYYSRKNCEGKCYPHNFYEYAFLETL